MTAKADHHQVMLATDKSSRDSVVLAESEEGDSLEVIVYRRTRCLCHQPHPEWEEVGSLYQQYFMSTVEHLLSGD